MGRIVEHEGAGIAVVISELIFCSLVPPISSVAPLFIVAVPEFAVKIGGQIGDQCAAVAVVSI